MGKYKTLNAISKDIILKKKSIFNGENIEKSYIFNGDQWLG